MNKKELHQLQEGTILADRYEIGYVLGQGGFGITYSGTDNRLAMKVAIKEFYPQSIVYRNIEVTNEIQAYSEDAKDQLEKGKGRFLEEAKCLAKFASEPGVVCVRDYFEANNTAYIVMEFVEGHTLKEHLTKGNMSFAESVKLMTPVMIALDKIHKKGLIHRDISPSNIMILDDLSAKLIDFGATREYSHSDEKSMSIMLKRGYAPEEQYRSNGFQGPWTDIYALSATIYKMVTGQVPEDAINRLFEDNLKKPSELTNDILEAEEAALLKGLEVNAKDRPQSMFEFLKLLNGIDSTSRPDSREDTAYIDDEKTEFIKEDICTAAGESEEATVAPLSLHNNEAGDIPVAAKEVKSGKQVASKQIGKSNKKKKKSKSKFSAIFIAIIAIVVAFVLVRSMLGDSSHSNNSADYSDTVITKAIAKSLVRNKELQKLSLSKCTIDDEALEVLSKAKSIRIIELSDCTGFTTLNPLAKIDSLYNLYIGYYKENGENITPFITEEFTGVTSLTIRRANLGGDDAIFTYFPNLTNLDLDFSKGLGEGSYIADFKNMEELYLSYTDLNQAAIKYIAECNNLRALVMTNDNLNDLSPLSNLTKLERIVVSDNQLTNLRGLENCYNLRDVNADNNKLVSIEGLPVGERLRYLRFTNNEIESLEGLEAAEALYILAAGRNKLTDISVLQNKPELKTLNLNDNLIADISPLKTSMKLENVNISNNKIVDIDALRGASQMVVFRAGNNQISDISALDNWDPKLERLGLENNAISDITPIAKHTGLKYLELYGNNIESLAALRDCSILDYLSVHDNELTNLDGLQNAARLKFLNAANNQISDISQLAVNDTDAHIGYVLEHNQISDISRLKGSNIAFLSIHDNDISDYSSLAVGDGHAKMMGKLYVSITDTSDNVVEELANIGFSDGLNIVDLDEDSQTSFAVRYREKMKELYSISGKAHFLTGEEADQEIKQYISKIEKSDNEDAEGDGNE